ncbi:flavodoxin-dependent (E)-4-hydroxy-3-methylbut-2-enyl-diphosphate synthase [Microaerobacter geothermalis]|uniref:flavodoxin-dependent (E)-4-hydroxy-3-methylbut-2-enyl-diphosphate synthase n=1 Tax=Microaerobacter geothermalis TaxID=674972 RepID=UPI001F18792E|nr:flavodoxin-dependent (E)-4-hydroxy-3-methylbut-2-enyl-diphosphate synthase [Microaerobacter geothermalis]MCF6093799.1 flavodoxin-dependent (E)-4-hydroxy-3-methylbut-2-enyl-diphosphate synthase [Microaerobacter geothermalis]
MFKREETRPITVGNVQIGGQSSVVIQSMTTTDTRNVEATLNQIQALADVGCQIVRLAVINEDAARAIKKIKERSPLPLVADIHFDYKLALIALESGIDKIRINPGNIGSKEKVKAVVEGCREKGVPIRIGVNSGSVEKRLLDKYGYPSPEAIVESALTHVEILEELDFYNIVVSLKSSDVPAMIQTYQLMAEKRNYPLHVGVTEAGTVFSGGIKSAVGIGTVLSYGIGDTIRVSLTGDPTEEIKVAKQILRSLELSGNEPVVVSCPSCGRCQIELIELANKVEEAVSSIKKPLKIAVMGCAVNGPGEAREADVGVAGGNGEGLIFRNGEIVRKVKEDELFEELMLEVNAVLTASEDGGK